MIRPSMIRWSLAAAALLAGAALALSPARGQEGGLERFEAPPPAHASPAPGLSFAVSYPQGWLTATWGAGVRTRFYPPDAEGAHAATTYFEVNLVPKDEPAPDALLFEAGGLEKWVGETRPRYEVEDQRRSKVGPKGVACEALLVKDPGRKLVPDRRELIVLVPAEGGLYLLRFSAPLSEFSGRSALWKSILDTFEPRAK